MLLRPYLVAAALLSASLAVHATPLQYNGTVSVTEGVQNGTPFSATSTAPTFAAANGVATASFSYVGAINFSNTAAQNAPGPGGDLNSTFFASSGGVTGTTYTGSGTVTYNSATVANYTSLASFLASSGSASGFAYGSYYTFNLGTLLAGTVLTITHDDGVALYQNGSMLSGTTASPTSVVSEKVTITNASAPITLYYARENGSPSILQIDAAGPVPEPSSIALLGTGLLGMAGMVRRRFAA